MSNYSSVVDKCDSCNIIIQYTFVCKHDKNFKLFCLDCRTKCVKCAASDISIFIRQYLDNQELQINRNVQVINNNIASFNYDHTQDITLSFIRRYTNIICFDPDKSDIDIDYINNYSLYLSNYEITKNMCVDIRQLTNRIENDNNNVDVIADKFILQRQKVCNALDILTSRTDKKLSMNAIFHKVPFVRKELDFSKIVPSSNFEVIMANLIYTPRKLGHMLMILVGGGGANCGGSGYIDAIVIKLNDFVQIEITIGCGGMDMVSGGKTSIKINEDEVLTVLGGESGNMVPYEGYGQTNYLFIGGSGFSGGGSTSMPKNRYSNPRDGPHYPQVDGIDGGTNGSDGGTSDRNIDIPRTLYTSYGMSENRTVGKGSKSSIIDELNKLYPGITPGKGGKGAKCEYGKISNSGGGWFSHTYTGSYIGYGGGAGGLSISHYNVSGGYHRSCLSGVMNSGYFEAEGGQGFGAGGAGMSNGANGCVIIDYIEY